MFKETPIKSDKESEISFLKRCFEKWDELLFPYEIEKVEKYMGNKYVIHMNNGVTIYPYFDLLSFHYNKTIHNVINFEKLKNKLVYIVKNNFDVEIKE